MSDKKDVIENKRPNPSKNPSTPADFPTKPLEQLQPPEEQKQANAIVVPMNVVNDALSFMSLLEKLPPGKNLGQASAVLQNLATTGKPVYVPGTPEG
ncbi:hypothetical protein N9X87_00080 [bacterium]|nr:hypothetical protein [bacterium]